MNTRYTHRPAAKAAMLRLVRSRPMAAAWLALVVATALVLALARPAHSTSPTPATPVVGERQSFADLVERVQPAVVNVSTRTSVARASMPELPFNIPKGSPLEEQFKEFFRRQFPGGRGGPAPEAQGVGSGFIVDGDGHVVTNHHVVRNADKILVTLNDGTELTATVVGHDDKTDLALLKIEHDEPLPFVSFGNSKGARVGDWVIAMGSPFGLGGTVTAGIISARGRDIRSGPFDDFLQVDAPINRGNSGGPLFDQSGQVIGVNTAIFSPSGGSVGIGFAIPSELASQVVEALKSDGTVKRGWMGVSIQSLSPELAESFGLEAPTGALVSGVLEGAPAEKAGVKVGDVIVTFDGESIESMRELPRVVAGAKAGDTVEVEIIREGTPRTLELEVGHMPGGGQVAAARTTSDGHGALGLALAELDEATRERLGLDEDATGVLIGEVNADSPAAREGLRPGDVILRVGRESVSKPAEVREAVREAARSDRKSVVMLVSRNGNERFVAVPFERG